MPSKSLRGIPIRDVQYQIKSLHILMENMQLYKIKETKRFSNYDFHYNHTNYPNFKFQDM